MENYVDITTIIKDVASVIAVIVVIFKYVTPLIKSKLTGSQWDNLEKWANKFVRAYEILIHGASGLGEERRKKVMEKLRQLCNKHGYDFDETDLRAALEDAWSDMTGKTNKDNKTNIETLK